MSSSAQSYGSFDVMDSKDDKFLGPPGRTVFTQSYAAATTKRTSTHTSTEQTMAFTETEKELHDIIAALQVKVSRLKGNQTPVEISVPPVLSVSRPYE